MNPIIQKTLGGLSKQYYFRQLVFGLILFALVGFFLFGETSPDGGSNATFSFSSLIFLIISTLLYPYSRFVYETVVGFFMGDNVFFGSALSMMIAKFVSMIMCWVCAILIAPIGLLYLYFHHSKQEKVQEQ